MESKPKNREWVKNAAIIFLAVLLVLTFFSNTIMNHSLPEVATQMVNNGSVTAQVRGTGTVTANGSHQVKADQTREIRSVMVRAGQEVNAGDVLFILGEGDSSELETAQDTLRQLQLSYQRAAISSPVFNYKPEERRLKAAKEALDAALEAEEAARAALDSSLNIPQSELDAAYERLQEAIDTSNTLEQRADEVTRQAEQAVEDALKEYNEIRKELGLPEVDSVSMAIASALSAGPATGGYVKLTAASSGGSVRLLSTGATENDDPAADGSAGDDSSAVIPDDPNDSSILEGTPSAPESSGGQTEVPDNDRTDASADEPADPPISSEQQRRLEEARRKLADAQLALDMLSFPELTAAQNNVDRCQAQYDALLSAGGAHKSAYDAAVAARKEAEEAYYDLKDALDFQKQNDKKSSQLSALELSDISAQIEKQKKIIEQLSGGVENQITANVSGLVESIECTAGDLVIPDQVLCTIEVPDMGYTLSFSVTNEQARRLNPGDTATVSNYYWGRQIVATLSTIRTDPRNPQTNKLLTFDLTGDASNGAELTLAVGQRSATYDTVIPNSAIRTDSNGSFVLKIEAKNSPLGNRYIARRVEVEVLASDDINSAVSGDLNSWSDYVITTSNAPVNSGDMVRMADN